MDAKELRPGERVFENTDGDGWDLLGGEMRADEIVQDPIGSQAGLEGRLGFGIGVGFAPITSQASAEGTVEGFQVIRMNVLII